MNYIKILGSSGTKTKLLGTTCFQIAKDIIVDAGNIISSLGDNAIKINHIFLTHSHSDHINDLPFVIESFFEQRDKPLIIYGSKQTLEAIKTHTFNNVIWPDFTKIDLTTNNEKSLILKEIKPNETTKIGDYEIKALEVNHIDGAFGFSVLKGSSSNGYIISGDTHTNEIIWDEINNNDRIKYLIVECSFPSRMDKLAKSTKHYSPSILKDELKKLKRGDIEIFLYHLKHIYMDELTQEIEDYRLLSKGGKVLEEGDIIYLDDKNVEKNMISANKFDRIMDINLELSSQLDKNRLFEMILTFSRDLTKSEAGTLYIVSKEEKSLEFKIVQNVALNIFKSNNQDGLNWPNLPLYNEDGTNNNKMATVVSALEKKVINISDAYDCDEYIFDGTKEFDKSTGYRSKSMLVIPLINHEDDVIGVLQLINKIRNFEVVEFNEKDEKLVKALAGQAALALTNSYLINNMEDLLNSYVTIIADAIDTKSIHTGKHIEKVAKIVDLVANEIHNDKNIYREINYTEDNLKEIELAAYMHDVGKISIPEYIMEKATKLEAFIDRIEIIKQRFEILKRDLEIMLLKNEITQEFYNDSLKQIKEDIAFLEEANIGSEFMDDDKIERIKHISQYNYQQGDKKVPFLTQNEIENLSIRKGTLTTKEKEIMNSHADLSYKMLSTLPFPKKYSKVLNIAVNHHEKLNGTGYPRGLLKEQISLEDSIMILADIFEALTANDRPYKKGKRLSEVFKILTVMANENEIDKDLLNFFFGSKALKEYSKDYLNEYQVDV